MKQRSQGLEQVTHYLQELGQKRQPLEERLQEEAD